MAAGTGRLVGLVFFGPYTARFFHGKKWGKQPKRRQWRMKRGCFEEVSRLAALKGPGIG
jgi:hypothetical protein